MYISRSLRPMGSTHLPTTLNEFTLRGSRDGPNSKFRLHCNFNPPRVLEQAASILSSAPNYHQDIPQIQHFTPTKANPTTRLMGRGVIETRRGDGSQNRLDFLSTWQSARRIGLFTAILAGPQHLGRPCESSHPPPQTTNTILR